MPAYTTHTLQYLKETNPEELLVSRRRPQSLDNEDTDMHHCTAPVHKFYLRAITLHPKATDRSHSVSVLYI